MNATYDSADSQMRHNTAVNRDWLPAAFARFQPVRYLER